MKPFLYVRTEMSIPGAGDAVHIAELETLDDTLCRLCRMIELGPNEAIVGAATQGKTVGGSQKPNELVPHPNTYDQFPDISAQLLTEEEFEGLWNEARALFPEL